MLSYKPFLFIKTVVVWGQSPDDAEDRLQDELTNIGGDLFEGWAYDEDTSLDPVFIKNMGGPVEVEE